MPTELTENILKALKKVPKGKVATYGSIAARAGNPQAARQVVRILNIYSDKENIAWYRIINSQGKISLPKGRGYEMQKSLLEDEGIVFSKTDKIDLEKYLW